MVSNPKSQSPSNILYNLCWVNPKSEKMSAYECELWLRYHTRPARCQIMRRWLSGHILVHMTIIVTNATIKHWAMWRRNFPHVPYYAEHTGITIITGSQVYFDCSISQTILIGFLLNQEINTVIIIIQNYSNNFLLLRLLFIIELLWWCQWYSPAHPSNC